MRDNKEVAIEFHARMDAIAAGKADWSRPEELFTDDFVAHMVGTGGTDLAGYRAGVTAFMDAFDGYRHEIVAQVSEGDTVATRITWTGKHTAEFLGVPATGRDVSITVMNFIRVVDGKAAEFWPSFDGLGLLDQIQ